MSDVMETLVAFRERHHLTQTDLARLLGVDHITVSRWELGYRAKLPETLIGLALEGLAIQLGERDFVVAPPTGQEWRVYYLACPVAGHGTVAAWAQPRKALVVPTDAAAAAWLQHRLSGCTADRPDFVAGALPDEVAAPA